MSIFQKFETAIGSSVNSLFSKFGSKDLKPVDIMSSLKNEIDQKAVQLNDGRVEIPNHFTVILSSDSYDRIESWGAVSFADELTDALGAFATSQGYSLFGPIKIKFQENLEMGKGEYGIQSEKGNSSGSESMPRPIPRIKPLIVPDAEPEPILSAVRLDSVDTFTPSKYSPSLVLGDQVFKLTKRVTILGRAPNADISIDDKGISRNHLEFKIQDSGQVVVSDLGSTNGLYVEGHHTPAALLQDGNLITVGRTRLHFRMN
jgi:hypothetical protein